MAMLKGIARPLIGSLAMALALYGLQSGMSAPPALMLVLKVMLGAAVYISVVLALWLLAGKPAGAETYLLGKLKIRFPAFIGTPNGTK